MSVAVGRREPVRWSEGPHDAWRFVTKLSRCHARRARGGAKEGGILKEYVDRLSGEPAQLAVCNRRPACRSGVSAVAVELFMHLAGEGERPQFDVNGREGSTHHMTTPEQFIPSSAAAGFFCQRNRSKD
jgi:hypothetical protein